jgi:L-lactate dehydrogenase complex protein LldF
MKPVKDHYHLSFASTLCGACTEVCPVKIPLHDLLLLNRNESVEAEITGDRFMMKNMARVLGSRKLLEMPGAGTKKMVLNYFVSKQWGKRRTMPEPAKKSFSRMWTEMHEKKKE